MGLRTEREVSIEQFHSLKSARDVASLLEVSYQRLVYHIYKVKPRDRYKRFSIPKKNGGSREITAPVTAIKLLQRKLIHILNTVHQPKAACHSFTLGKSIVTNARAHKAKKHVLTIDLQNFFPSVNFGRVRGMFMNKPYSLPPEVATILAQICCFKDERADFLPQGAPSSPVITNMLCAKMDSQLRRLAQEVRCTYTRYADDLTFSSSLKEFPTKLAQVGSGKQGTVRVKLGTPLKRIINDNGFAINSKKTRLQTPEFRQVVTGLTVNRFPNIPRRFVRKVRAMLRAWKEFGLKAAEDEFRKKYYDKLRHPLRTKPSFVKVLRGRIEFIGMVRGKEDLLYLKYLNKYNALGELPLVPIPTLQEQQKSIRLDVNELKSGYKMMEAELDFATQPIEFDFLPTSFSGLLQALKFQNRQMQRAKKKDDLVEFCSRATLQLEYVIRRFIELNYQELVVFAETHPSLSRFDQDLKNLHRARLFFVFRLLTEFRKTELLQFRWLRSAENYWYHDLANPYANNYCLLNYVREIRNLAGHGDATGSLDPLHRLNEKIKEKKNEINELQHAQIHNETKLSSLSYQIQTLEQAKKLFDDRMYPVTEETLYDYMKVLVRS